jgi:antitoxin (DNA-binding transcriptional repressor) of toxin-antitoxin stability system
MRKDARAFMTIVTTAEAQAMLPRLLASVAQGEEVLITDGGTPIARLTRPGPPAPIPFARSSTISTPEATMDDDERPWRGVFAIESPGDPYEDSNLHLPSVPLSPEQQPADILWDRVKSADD